MTEQLSAPLDAFKPRELEILNLMAEGLSNQIIADRLFITKETVRWYNKQIYSKLGTSRRTEAIALARRFGLIGNAERDTAPGATIGLSTLPITNGPFIGRDAVLAELVDLMNKPDVRLISLVAAGGMGKSRLALELGNLISSKFEHGAVFVDLTTIDKHTDIAFAALESLRVPLSGKAKPHDVLLDYCRGKSLLMIFDNWEHVLPGASLLADIMETAPRIKLIATSRERLNLRVETVYFLEPVAEHADRLFIETAQMMHSNFELIEDDLADVGRIVQLVGGMPLGLVLAATWTDLLSVREIGDEIEQSLEFLSAELGDMPERQRSIHAVIDPSWRRLTDVEKRAFMWASLFRGGFTRHTFQQVTGASVRVLQKLMERSLLMPGFQRRYDMHPLLRHYAHEKMEAMGLLQAAHTAHLNTFAEYAKNWRAAMFDGQYREALEALETEQENFRTVMDWALDGHGVATGSRLAVDLADFWEVRSQAYEAEYYLTRAVDAGAEAIMLAQILRWRCRFRYRLGMIEPSLQDGQQAIALAEKHNDPETLVQSLIAVGYQLDITEQLPVLGRAVEIAETVGDEHLIARALNNLGNYYSALRMNEKALACYERSRVLYEQIGDMRGISMVVYNTGLVSEQSGDTTQALEYFEQSLQLKRAIGDRAGAARRLAVIATQMILEEEFEQAAVNLAESIRLCEEVGDRFRLSYALEMSAVISFISANFEAAKTELMQGLAVVAGMNEVHREVELHHLLALVYLAQNKIELAREHTKYALDRASQAKRPYTNWLSLNVASVYLFAAGKIDLCVRVSAVIHRERNTGSQIDVRYALNPHLHRLKAYIGEEKWKAAQHSTQSVEIKDIFAEVFDFF